MYDENSIRNEETKAKKTGRIVLSVVFCVLFFGLIGIIVVRNLMMQPTAGMKQLVQNESFLSAKDEYKEELGIYTLYEYNSTDTSNIFVISNIRYIKDIGQFQFTLRWNRETVKQLARSAGTEIPGEGEPFRFAIADDTGRVYTAYEYLGDARYQYEFRRMVFDGIDTEGIKSLSVLAFTTFEKDEILLEDAIDEIPLFIKNENGARYRMSGRELEQKEPTEGLEKVEYRFDK